MIFFSNEAWFHLHGEVNSRNSRYWSLHNLWLIHEVPIHDFKIGVWCNVSTDKIMGPIFFEDIISPERCMKQLNENRNNTFLQQDSTTAHTTRASMDFTREVFRDSTL